MEGGWRGGVCVLVPCHHGRLRERDARGPGPGARARAVRCAHALLRRALLHQVDIDQPQGLELPPVLLDLTQAVLQGMATVRGCTVMGEVSGLRGTVGAPPCFRIACG